MNNSLKKNWGNNIHWSNLYDNCSARDKFRNVYMFVYVNSRYCDSIFFFNTIVFAFVDPLSALVQAAITAAPNSTEDGSAVKEEDQANGVKTETEEKPVS